MVDLSRVVTPSEMPLGHISRMSRVVDEHVVPRRVFRRTTSRDLLVPLIVAAELAIDFEDDPPVPESEVLDDLADEESWI